MISPLTSSLSVSWAQPWGCHPSFLQIGESISTQILAQFSLLWLCQLRQTFSPGTLEWRIEEDEGQTNFCMIRQSRLQKLRVLWWKKIMSWSCFLVKLVKIVATKKSWNLFYIFFCLFFKRLKSLRKIFFFNGLAICMKYFFHHRGHHVACSLTYKSTCASHDVMSHCRHESMPLSVMWPCDSNVAPQHDLLAACCSRINESTTQPATAETAVIDNVSSQPWWHRRRHQCGYNAAVNSSTACT
jgi:hypothetical protein